MQNIKLEEVSVETLTPYERNSRIHTQEQIDQIKNSINEWGFTIPILIDEQNTILAGHARYESAKQLGMDKVPCIQAKGWNEQQKKAYIIADNKLAENSQWDLGVFYQELKLLDREGFDLNLTGIDDNLDLNYNPMLTPEYTQSMITDNDIQNTQNQFDSRFEEIRSSNNNEGVEVVCPKCAHEFRFSGV